MCTQSGSIQDLTAYSDHLPSSVLGSEAEPDSSSRQEFAHSPSVPHDMGLRFMTIAPPDDVRYVNPPSLVIHMSLYLHSHLFNYGGLVLHFLLLNLFGDCLLPVLAIPIVLGVPRLLLDVFSFVVAQL